MRRLGRGGTHRHPADLGPQVSEVKCGRGTHRQLLQNILILQGLALCGETGQGSGAAQALPTATGVSGNGERRAVLTRVQTEGLAGRVPLRICGESGASQCTAWQGPGTPQHLPPPTKPLWPMWLQDTALKNMGRSRMLSFLKPSNGIPADGHTGAPLQALGGEAPRRGPTQRPRPKQAAEGSVAGPWTYGS